MAPRDHRIHLGRSDSPKTPPQNHSSTKQLLFGTIFRPKKVPGPKCRPQISPEADFGNSSKSLQQVRTANPSEILSRTHPSKLQTEPRGEKLIFRIFPARIPRCGSDPSTRNLDCLQARHVLCLQARHPLCLQPRHLLCQQTRDLQSAKTSPPHCQPRGSLGRLQISCLLTQQMSSLQTQQMSCACRQSKFGLGRSLLTGSLGPVL